MKKEMVLMLPHKLAQVFWDEQDRYFIERIFEMAVENSRGKKQLLIGKTFEDLYTNRPLGKPLSETEREKLYNLVDFLPLTEIRNILKDLRMPEKEVKTVIHILFPYPLESKLLVARRPLVSKKKDQHEQKIGNEAKKRLKQLSGIIGQVEGMNKQSYFRASLPFDQSLFWLTYCKDFFDEFLKYYEKRKKDLLIDNNLDKNPQSHRFWSPLISKTVNVLNPYCHDGTCDRTACRETHMKAIRKVAELLKILHPAIWQEDVEQITAKIKTRYYSSM